MVTCVAFSADGKRLASAHFRYLKEWDAATWKELLAMKGGNAWFHSVAFSPDGKRLATPR
jgi:WD40 repeat protein